MEHNKIDKKYQYGWYGSCEEECNALYFDKLGDARNYIDSIVRVSYADGKSFEKYTSYDKENLDWVDNVITVIDVPLLKSTDEGLMDWVILLLEMIPEILEQVQK